MCAINHYTIYTQALKLVLFGAQQHTFIGRHVKLSPHDSISIAERSDSLRVKMNEMDWLASIIKPIELLNILKEWIRVYIKLTFILKSSLFNNFFLDHSSTWILLQASLWM